MATAELTLQNLSLKMQQLSAQTIDLGIVKDASGAALDISAGYTARVHVRLSRLIDMYPAIDLSGTFTYGSDGSLKLTKTLGQSFDLPVGTWQFAVQLSDDAFVTNSIHALGSIQVNGGQQGV